MKTYAARVNDSEELDEVEGIDSPVRGLAICRMPCPCGDSVYCLAHVRSGQALVYSHSAETFGATWSILGRVDWTRSAAEIELCPETGAVCREALALIPDGFRSEPAFGTDDVPGWEENL